MPLSSPLQQNSLCDTAIMEEVHLVAQVASQLGLLNWEILHLHNELLHCLADLPAVCTSQLS